MAEPDAVQADPKHYTVEAEDDRVRVLRVHYGGGEKSVPHSHPAHVAIFLTDANVRFNDQGEVHRRRKGKPDRSWCCLLRPISRKTWRGSRSR